MRCSCASAPRAEPNPRVQSELWEQAGLAFDEIAAQRDIDPPSGKRAALAAVARGRTVGFLAGARTGGAASVLLYLGVVRCKFESSFPVT
jgi:hypothetical protein